MISLWVAGVASILSGSILIFLACTTDKFISWDKEAANVIVVTIVVICIGLFAIYAGLDVLPFDLQYIKRSS